jgi:TRAP-type transport system periplasmic protein
MKRKTMYFLTIVMAIISLTIAGCSSGTTNSTAKDEPKESNETKEKIKLKFATYFPGTSPIYTDFTEPWMKRVTELTDGQVEFEYYPGEQLGKAGDLLQLTKDGVADISIFPANYYADQMPLSQMLLGLPNLSESSGQGTKAYNDLVQENETLLKTDYLNNGIRPIVTHVSPTYELWTTGKEIRVPSDLKGKKVKTAGGISNEIYSYMGAVPVAISHAETYEALEKGVIDIASYYAMAIKNSGTNELLKYAVFPHIGTVIQSVTINEKVWQGLPKDVQKAMKQAGEEITGPIGKVYVNETEKFNKEFVANGGVIAELTKEESKQWKTVTEEFTKKWLEKHKSDPKYKEVLNAYKEKLEEYK